MRLKGRTAAAAGAALVAVALLGACTMTERQIPQESPVAPADDLGARILRLERAVEESRAQAQAVSPELAGRLADLGQRVEELAVQVRQLHGRVDALERRPVAAPAADPAAVKNLEGRVAELSEKLAALDLKVNRQPAVAAPAPSPTTPEPPPSPARSEPKPAAPPQPPAAGGAPLAGPAPGAGAQPQELYDRGYTLYKQGRHEDAREAFAEYLRVYPETKLSDNALFWIGESYYDQNQYEQAILEYDKVVQKFPDGDKVPSALLKQAFAFDAIGDPVDARILLKKLLREHPSSEQAAIARKKLEILGE